MGPDPAGQGAGSGHGQNGPDSGCEEGEAQMNGIESRLFLYGRDAGSPRTENDAVGHECGRDGSTGKPEGRPHGRCGFAGRTAHPAPKALATATSTTAATTPGSSLRVRHTTTTHTATAMGSTPRSRRAGLSDVSRQLTAASAASADGPES